MKTGFFVGGGLRNPSSFCFAELFSPFLGRKVK